MNRFQQICQAVLFSVLGHLITIHRLTQQSDFLDPLVGKNLHFMQDISWWTALFGTARHRYHAIRTKFIATNHDPNERLIRRWPHFWFAKRIVTLEAVADFSPRTLFAVQADCQ